MRDLQGFSRRARFAVTETGPRIAARRHFLRARARFADGRLVATPMPRQGSGILSSMLGANALLVVDAGTHQFDAGAEIDALLIGPLE